MLMLGVTTVLAVLTTDMANHADGRGIRTCPCSVARVSRGMGGRMRRPGATAGRRARWTFCAQTHAVPPVDRRARRTRGRQPSRTGGASVGIAMNAAARALRSGRARRRHPCGRRRPSTRSSTNRKLSRGLRHFNAHADGGRPSPCVWSWAGGPGISSSNNSETRDAHQQLAGACSQRGQGCLLHCCGWSRVCGRGVAASCRRSPWRGWCRAVVALSR